MCSRIQVRLQLRVLVEGVQRLVAPDARLLEAAERGTVMSSRVVAVHVDQVVLPARMRVAPHAVRRT
jgi:hypothetical protein